MRPVLGGIMIMIMEHAAKSLLLLKQAATSTLGRLASANCTDCNDIQSEVWYIWFGIQVSDSVKRQKHRQQTHSDDKTFKLHRCNAAASHRFQNTQALWLQGTSK